MHKLGLWSFTWADYFSDLDVAACVFKENGPIETFDVAFESSQNKQQYGTKITGTEVREKSYDD